QSWSSRGGQSPLNIAFGLPDFTLHLAAFGMVKPTACGVIGITKASNSDRAPVLAPGSYSIGMEPRKPSRH
ncbi:unnamed protein product, partial [Dovyalis caffra]